ncbi:GTP cyclohydrolase II [Neobacillus sp. PS3-40]|uniref:GTP cyclohydrolase II n=1 Tax=Neobacillus sp. PS3-40 TaxID=3070679 RepID=UPI0027E0C528|nr:GTP cyclohydrolase II [Neobacillus sp. PS3-40]WML43146.1 GTP cyclohydrolase II [Neobacillus sp. PS3-40]
MLTANAVDMLKDKIKLIQQNEKVIYLVGPIKLPVNLDGKTVTFQWYCWLQCEELMDSTEKIIDKLSSVNLAEMQQSSVLVYGDFKNAEDAVVRMHSICHTGDIFGSKRCDCGYQLKESMKMIVDHGTGALFYLANHEGRGIGLFSKAMAYVLQENGMDTVEANLSLGFKDDVRNYDDAIEVLKSLRSKQVAIITNNPRKMEALRKSGFDISDREPLWGDESEFNKLYLQTKVNRSGHFKGGQPNE